MKESMALEHGPFLPWQQWAQSCFLGHEKHALAVLCPVTMACRTMVSQGVTARKTSVAQLAHDGCCDNGLVRPFHKVGHCDAWLHGVVVCRVAGNVGSGCTDCRRHIGLGSIAHGSMQGGAVRSQDWKALNFDGGHVGIFGGEA